MGYEFLFYFLQEGYISQYRADVVPDQFPLARVKLFVCGATGVGKTELVKSLKCRFLRSLFRKRSDSNITHMIQQRTHGILVHQTAIPNAGNFSIWDFSGLKSYYVLHEEFFSAMNALVILVFKVNDPFEQQVAQLRFWLALLKAKQEQSGKIRFAGRREHRPYIVLVGSFTTLPYVAPEGESNTLTVPPSPTRPPATTSRAPSPNQVQEVFDIVRTEFSDYFTFSEQVFQIDCRLSQTNEIKALRVHLGSLRSKVIHVSWYRIL